MSNRYTIELIHSMGWYAAKNQNDEYIVVEAMGCLFDMGDCISVKDDSTIYNETKNECANSVLQAETSRLGAINFLRDLVPFSHYDRVVI